MFNETGRTVSESVIDELLCGEAEVDFNHIFLEYDRPRDADSRRGEVGTAWTVITMKPPSYYLGKMDELRKDFGGRCIMCGGRKSRKNEPLQFAHLKKTPMSKIHRGRGMANRYHDIKKNRQSYVLMCRYCHIIFDGPGGGNDDYGRSRDDDFVDDGECPF